MNILKSIWNWLCGVVADFIDDLIATMKDKILDITSDRELLNLCVEAIEAAIREGLTGEKAWTYARDRLTTALKAAGKELTNCAIDTALQNAYAAYKELKERNA